MARGFNTTFGTASTDRIQTILTTQNTLRSYSIWYRERTDAGNAGSHMDKSNAGTQHERIINAGDGTGSIQYKRLWSGGLANWGYPKPLDAPTWHNTIVTYDSSVTTAPLMYLDGSPQTVTEYAAASGSVTNNADSYWIGNRGNGDRPTDGMLAEFAVWDRILSADEAWALGHRYSPLFFLRSLVEYVPMIRDNISLKNAAPTITGALVQSHPPIIYPNPQRIQRLIAAVTPAPVSFISGGWISL